MENINSLSLIELKKLKNKVDREVEKRLTQTKGSFTRKLKKLAAENGVALTEILPGAAEQTKGVRKRKPSALAGRTLEPKYFCRIDPAKTWSGRGKRPEWVETWLANGGMLEELTQRPW